jgi:hypothetical protein
MKRKTLPTSAGLKGLLPNPPNDNLPTPIANRLPRITSQTGKLEGRHKESNKPVITAEPSCIVVFFRRRNFWIRNSNKTDENTDTDITITAPHPKYRIDASTAGIRAMITPYIRFGVVSFPKTCGEGETVSNLLI